MALAAEHTRTVAVGTLIAIPSDRPGDGQRDGDHHDDPIAIHLAANAPKALAAVGEVGNGWITVALGERRSRSRRVRSL